MQGLKSAVTGSSAKENKQAIGMLTQNKSSCPSLSWKYRLWGFIICVVLGFAMSFLSTFALFTNNFIIFAVIYTAGNIVALSSTLFLMGPLYQLKAMFKNTRIFATIMFLLAMAMTLTFAFWLKNAGLCILGVILQFLALTWYSLSYIPYARTLIKNCVRGMI
mmetsp:Transcript_2079/g.2307  ORF Transcript_2079/g.2307 Transcript_2079/m.2307 type:complete len:163 (-) Transcript_2079:90-578(-)